MNRYECSNGEKVTQSQIDRRRKNAYFQYALNFGIPPCQGCGKTAHAFAHIIPQARCKVLHKTELIWDTDNLLPACHSCNSIGENVSSEAIRKLKNFEYIKHYMSIHDPQRASKLE